uniref:Uncharacterized protein n=1 Tax=Cryptosporidium parvum TaxID=5807 RepID=F0X6F4_CRYPV
MARRFCNLQKNSYSLQRLNCKGFLGQLDSLYHIFPRQE